MALLHARETNPSPPPADGTLCIIHENYNSLTPLTLHTDAHTDNRYGRFSHNHLLTPPTNTTNSNTLGRRWHTSTPSPQSAGFVHALQPNPILWSLALTHRTQIVYPHDISLILTWLGVTSGMTVVECGTGSGAMTCALGVTVGLEGRVWSFEYHTPRYEAAKHELKQLLADVVHLQNVDVVQKGFVGVKSGSVDAVFLDMPCPYNMAQETHRILKENAVVCCFSPCLEQVARNIKAYTPGFYDIRTVTATLKTYETREQMLRTPGFDKDNGEWSEQGGAKRRKTELSRRDLRKLQRSVGQERKEVADRRGGEHRGRVIRAKGMLHSKAFASMKGHTSYLTFARRRRGGVMEGVDEETAERVNSCTIG